VCYIVLEQVDGETQYLTKGPLVLVEGRLQTDTTTGGPRLFQRQDGSSGAQFEIMAEDIRLLGGSKREESSQAAHEAEEESSIPF
jgi:single-strand DNA-binding protein